ncbi:hypothetical protein [Streptomyces lushanensis]|uniref:hypothetical protein n=1 Tax=Streptomyces lushanensis TaxID=1434255 RepID=UPI00082C0A18|nr:hypothetical protein [Streptomyces lushanensis]
MKRLLGAVAAALFVLTGCEGGDIQPEPSVSAARAKLSETWTKKFEVSARESPYNCVKVPPEQCREWLVNIRTLTRALEKTIEDQHLERRYPETLAQAREMERASDMYGDAGCEGADNEDGPACSASARALAWGAPFIPVKLSLDENRYDLEEIRRSRRT